MVEDKKSIIAIMYSNMASDLSHGYDYFGKSIQTQKDEIARYEAQFEKELDSFKSMSDEEVNRWCFYDMKKRGARFLYQPDKRYFLVTLSSTGFEYGRCKTVKAHGLFIAKNINQIRKFLTNDVDWRISGGYSSDYSKFRIYTGGYGDDPICSDTDFERFNYYVCRELYSLFSYSDLEKDFGALDVNSPPSNLNKRELPFHKL